MTELEAVVKAAFLLVGMSVAGVAHVLWLRSPLARRFDAPIDGGLTLRGRRLFGANKRVCGFMVLPPAAALSFALLSDAGGLLPRPLEEALWPMSTLAYAGLGLAAGLAFMLAELPNSFIKRQLDVAPGAAPTQPGQRWLVLLIDRLDSVLGVLIVVSLLVPLPALSWLWVLMAGPLVHAVFSTALYALGLKARAL